MVDWKTNEPNGHWMEWLVSMIQDQGTWGTSYARYRLDKTNKTAYVLDKNKVRPPDIIDENCQRIAQAFTAIGWRVMDGSQ